MKVTVKFDPRDDIAASRLRIEGACLTIAERSSSFWESGRTLVFFTTRSLSDVADDWEREGYNFSEFARVTVEPDSPAPDAQEFVMPGGLDISEQAARLVGRSYDSLTPTEDSIAQHLSLYGELYWCSYDSSTGIAETDAGNPASPISVRVDPGSPAREAAWELAHTVEFVLSEMVSK